MAIFESNQQKTKILTIFLNSILLKLKKTFMQQIIKLKMQIKALNIKLQGGQVKNIHAVKNKILALKQKLKIEEDNYAYENFLSR